MEFALEIIWYGREYSPASIDEKILPKKKPSVNNFDRLL
jgi:hypothetical protein